jgi:hypothetical protein
VISKYHGIAPVGARLLLAIGVWFTTACTDPGSGDGNACGDNVCANGETPKTCPEDCDAPGPRCGDQVCDSGETVTACPQDCTCGNHVCDSSETMASCPQDCTCGNHVCDASETTASCPQDCPAVVCGNAVCESSETATSCPQDCTATLKTQNNSSLTINHLYVYGCTNSTEGPDQLAGRVIASATSFSLNRIPPGCYRFHATTLDGSGWRTPQDVTMRAAEILTWTLTN